MRFLSTPNLPEGRCCLAIGNQLYPDAKEELKRNGVTVLEAAKERCLPLGLSEHADMLVLPLGDGLFLLAKGQLPLADKLKALGGQIVGEVAVGSSYPKDVPLNTAIFKRAILLNPISAAKKTVDFFTEKSYNMIEVRQGYTKCATAVVSDSALITEDKGICRAALENGMDALLIKPGHVRLNGYSSGLIGGCCGKIAKDVLCFNGRIETHPNYADMRDFALAHGVRLYSLSRSALYDNGGLLPIQEIIQ